MYFPGFLHSLGNLQDQEKTINKILKIQYRTINIQKG
jgi:hypothetical protein